MNHTIKYETHLKLSFALYIDHRVAKLGRVLHHRIYCAPGLFPVLYAWQQQKNDEICMSTGCF